MTLDIKTFPFNVVVPYLRSKWGPYHCEVCKTMNWTTVRVDEYPMSGLIAFTNTGENQGAGWPVMPVLCNTCGNTKILSLDFVVDWLQTDEGKEALVTLELEEREKQGKSDGFE